MDILSITISVLSLVLCAVILIVMLTRHGNSSVSQNDIEKIRTTVSDSLSQMSELVSKSIVNENKLFTEKFSGEINGVKENVRAVSESIAKNYVDTINLLNMQLGKIEKALIDGNEKNSETIKNQISEIRKETNEKLGEIQKTVNEKLEETLKTRLNDSFENVIKQIGNVGTQIGEIKSLASDVSSLKTVLSNVKTKGIVGEIVLGRIIAETLTKEQYEENIVTKDGSKDPVEFAVKMPAGDDGFVYLPIDSKFPLESYNRLKDASENADKDGVENARKELRTNIKKFAKDISQKYICVPKTTDFAIMFLPIEGLYIEAIDSGLFEEIQRDYKVNIVGPSTLTALLNALQMGFKSYAIQKRSSEVFKLLNSVRKEFENFAQALQDTQDKFHQVDEKLENLVGVRTRQLKKNLQKIDTLSPESDEEQ